MWQPGMMTVKVKHSSNTVLEGHSTEIFVASVGNFSVCGAACIPSPAYDVLVVLGLGAAQRCA